MNHSHYHNQRRKEKVFFRKRTRLRFKN